MQQLLDELLDGDTPGSLARRANLPRSTVNRIASGDSDPRYSTVQALAKATGRIISAPLDVSDKWLDALVYWMLEGAKTPLLQTILANTDPDDLWSIVSWVAQRSAFAAERQARQVSFADFDTLLGHIDAGANDWFYSGVRALNFYAPTTPKGLLEVFYVANMGQVLEQATAVPPGDKTCYLLPLRPQVTIDTVTQSFTQRYVTPLRAMVDAIAAGETTSAHYFVTEQVHNA